MSPADGKQLEVGRNFSGQSYKRFLPLAMNFNPPRRIIRSIGTVYSRVAIEKEYICRMIQAYWGNNVRSALKHVWS